MSAEAFDWLGSEPTAEPAEQAEKATAFSWLSGEEEPSKKGIAPEDASLLGEFGRSFAQNAVTSAALIAGGPQALYGLAIGSDEDKHAGLQRFKEIAEWGQEAFPTSVEKISEVLDDPTPRNIALYISGSLGTLASMLPALGGAGLGVGLARGLATKASERALAKGLGEEAANAAAASVMKRAALAGAAGPAYVQNTMETYAGLAERGGQDERALTFLTGAAKTVLDELALIPVLGPVLAGPVSKGVRAAIESKFGKRLGAALIGFGAEGSTEGVQELLDIAAEESVSPHTESGRELALRVLDSVIKGGLAGGVAGTAGSFTSRAPVSQEALSKVDANQTGVAEREAFEIQQRIAQADVEAQAQAITEAEPEARKTLEAQAIADEQERTKAFQARSAAEPDIWSFMRETGVEPKAAEQAVEALSANKDKEGVAMPAEVLTPQTLNAISNMPASEGSNQALVTELRRLTTKLLGPQQYRVSFDDGIIKIPKQLPSGEVIQQELGGYTFNQNPHGWLARVALGFDAPWNVVHESFHLATLLGMVRPNEVAELIKNDSQIQTIIDRAVKEGWRGTQPGMQSRSSILKEEMAKEAPLQGLTVGQHETLAYGADAYSFLREKGIVPGTLPGGVRGVFERIRRFWKGMQDWFAGQPSLKNAIYDQFLEGRFAQRPIREDMKPGQYVDKLAAIDAWHGTRVEFDPADIKPNSRGEIWLAGPKREAIRAAQWAPSNQVPEGATFGKSRVIQFTIPDSAKMHTESYWDGTSKHLDRIRKSAYAKNADVIELKEVRDLMNSGPYYVILNPKILLPKSQEFLAAVRESESDVNAARSNEPGKQMGGFAKLFFHRNMIAEQYPLARPFSKAIDWMNDTRNALIFKAEQLIRPLHEVRGPEAINANEAILKSDELGQWAIEQDGKLSIGGITLEKPGEIAAYKGARATSEFFKAQMIQAYRTLLGLQPGETAAQMQQRAQGLTGSQKVFLENASEVMGQLEGIEGYMPHVRRGDHWITVKGPDGETVHAEKFFMPRFGKEKKIKEMRARLQAQYPDGQVGVPYRDNQYNRGGQLLGALGAIEGIANAFSIGDPAITEQFFNDLKNAMTVAGFRTHLRKRKNVPGYVTPETRADYARNAFDSYIPSAASFIAKQLARPRINEGMKAIEAGRDVTMQRWAENLRSYIDSPQEATAFIRTLAFHSLLGFNLSSMVMNMTQVPMALVPFLQQFSGIVPNGITMKAFVHAGKAVELKKFFSNTPIYFDKRESFPYLSDQEFAFMQQQESIGKISPVLKQEYEAQAQEKLRQLGLQVTPLKAKAAHAVSKFMTYSGAFFAVSEQLNRVTAGLAAMRLANIDGMLAKIQPMWDKSRMAGTPLTPEAFAQFAIEETQFAYGRDNNPEFMRGNVMGVATQFMGYPLQMMELFGKMLSRDGFFSTGPGKLGAFAMLAGIALTGGFWAQPGSDLARRLIELLAKFSGHSVNIDYTIRRVMADMGIEGRTADALLRGPFRGLTGIDISRRVDINPSQLDKADVSAPELLMGPAGQAVKQLVQAITKDIREEKWGKLALDLIPLLAVRNVGQAAAAGEEGFKDTAGRVVTPPEKVEAWDKVMKGIGFTPTQVSRAKELHQYAQSVVEGTKGKQQDFTRMLTDVLGDRQEGLRRGDSEAVMKASKRQQEIIRDIIAYNKGKAPADMLNVKGLVKSAVEQLKKDVSGGYMSPAQLKRIPLPKRGEVQKILGMYGESLR